MNFRSPSLEIRTPNTRWMLVGVVVTLCVQGALWLAFSNLVSLNEPVSQSRQVMISALFWMICAIVLWKAKPPQSRLHAVMSVLACVFFVALFGTAVAFGGLLIKGVMFDRRVLMTFSLLSLVLLVAQVVLAVPSAVVMQQVVLRRAAPQAPQLPG